MAESINPDQSAGWRIPKACQECRKRKIKCNGRNPCKTCQLRDTPCLYREVIRQRKKKHQERHDAFISDGATHSEVGARQEKSPALLPPPNRRNQSASYTFNNSVSATHMASPSCKVQLYYGPTSCFTLMHEIYRGLVNNQPTPPDEPEGEVEETGAGLDMFSFRKIFFGASTDARDSAKGPNPAEGSVMFLPYELAKFFLQRYLSTIYHLVPVRPKEAYERQLEELYGPSPPIDTDIWARSIILMALAMGSLATEQYAWGDILYERVKASCSPLDEVVNLETHAHFQTEQGRPNSAFLHLGVAARKAISTGLHKESPNKGAEEVDGVEERRTTFWSLFFYETWICYHVGRPTSLSSRDIGIAPPEDPFMLALAHLAKVMTRSVDELYGQRHESLLQMWRLARSIADDLRSYDAKMRHALGFGIDKGAQTGEVGVRQTVLITLYYHTILLTFRPFLIFRGRWRRDMKMQSHQRGSGTAKRPTEIPTWLNEACNHALNAARKTIHHLCEVALVNELVREMRYHGFFLTSACFTLIYDLITDDNVSSTHLPWIHATIQCLEAMRPGDPIQSSVTAIQTVLRMLHPSFEWIPPEEVKSVAYTAQAFPMTTQHYPSDLSPHVQNTVPEAFPNELHRGMIIPTLSNLQGFPMQHDIPDAAASVGGSDDLHDFTQSDMGWDFDFSTMDLESLFLDLSEHGTSGMMAGVE